MKQKIIECATGMFLKLGFKSITMDDIAGEMCISKKTIYKYFINKEVLIAESTETMHNTLMEIIQQIIAKNYNAIEENFEIRNMFKGVFQTADTSPLFQLKKHYPEIYDNIVRRELDEGYKYLSHNIEKGIAQGYYRSGINVEHYSRIYYMLTFSINENIRSEKEARVLEQAALEYHIRAIATEKGITELTRLLTNSNN